MGLAAMASKVLGTMQKIPLQNIAGDRVFGLYNAVYPFYQLLLVLATAGFPVAVSLLVAQRAAEQDHDGVRKVLSASVTLLTITGAAVFFVMWYGADMAAGMIGDSAAAPALRASSLALWTMPALAALRGYYQGLGRMLPTAASQLTEQTVRVGFMLTMLAIGWQLGWTDELLAAGATAGSAVGGLAGLVLLSALLLKDWRQKRATQHSNNNHSNNNHSNNNHSNNNGISWPIMRQLAVSALPVALGALAVPMLNVVDALTVPRLLRGEGIGEVEAMTQFGLYSRGQPLVQLVVMVAGAMAVALVPALAAARYQGKGAAAKQQSALALRVAWWAGGAAMVGLALLARPLNIMLYADDAATLTFALVGCTALAGALNATTAALLQGLGAVRTPALLMLAAAALKVALNAALVPALGITGAAWAGIAALTAVALLGAGAVSRAAGAAMSARSAASLALALAVLAAALLALVHGLGPLLEAWLPLRAAATMLALGGSVLGGALFMLAALRLGALTSRELSGLPGGEGLSKRLRRLRLIPMDKNDNDHHGHRPR